MRSASMMKLPLGVQRPPVTLSLVAFSTGMDSPVTIDSSTALAPFTYRAVDGNAFAGTDTQPVAALDLIEWRVSIPCHPTRSKCACCGAKFNSARIAPLVLCLGA